MSVLAASVFSLRYNSENNSNGDKNPTAVDGLYHTCIVFIAHNNGRFAAMLTR